MTSWNAIAPWCRWRREDPARIRPRTTARGGRRVAPSLVNPQPADRERGPGAALPEIVVNQRRLMCRFRTTHAFAYRIKPNN